MIKKEIKELLYKLSPSGYIVSLDLETTGIDKSKDKIIEIGAVKYDIKNGSKEYFSQLINPVVQISEFIEDLTGISNSDVEHMPIIDEVKNEFEEFYCDYENNQHLIIAHNANFDIGFSIQNEPKGISHALQQAENLVKNEKLLFVLGDNFFENNPLEGFNLNEFKSGALIFTKMVENPQEFGVAQMDQDGNVISIEEKPDMPKSKDAVVGIYMFDESVFEKISILQPSKRGEYEITDLCNLYVEEKNCKNFSIDGWWIDAGTPERIIELEQKLG